MAFRGWPAEAIEFYEGLEADNSKTYWQQNKVVYEELVRGPMDELLAELAPQYGEGRIFRPYRDVRFSKDKSPYKTAIAATLANGGTSASPPRVWAPAAACTCRRPINSTGTGGPWPTTGAAGSSRRSSPSSAAAASRSTPTTC